MSLSQDSFYRELNETEIILANMGKFNFDHPDAFDTDLMESVLQVSVDVYQIYSPLFYLKGVLWILDMIITIIAHVEFRQRQFIFIYLIFLIKPLLWIFALFHPILSHFEVETSRRILELSHAAPNPIRCCCRSFHAGALLFPSAQWGTIVSCRVSQSLTFVSEWDKTK